MLPFDFKELARLAKEDPEAFEARRRQLIEEEILAAPPELQPRLREIQAGVDAERTSDCDPVDLVQKYLRESIRLHGDGMSLQNEVMKGAVDTLSDTVQICGEVMMGLQNGVMQETVDKLTETVKDQHNLIRLLLAPEDGAKH